MSSDPLSGGPSPPPEPDSDPADESGRAARVAALGAALIDALEAHLPGARVHAEATGAYAFSLASKLEGGADAELIREAAKLHDVGMVYVPVPILRKPPAELDDGDRALLGSHIDAGARLAGGAGVPEDVCTWILDTRERFDGAGPKGLRGADIPLAARIIRVACALDLMVGAVGREATVDGLRAAAGGELDPQVVEAAATLPHRT